MPEAILFFQQLLLYLGGLFCALSLVRRQGLGISLFMAVLALHAGLMVYESMLPRLLNQISFSLAALYAPAVWIAVRERLLGWQLRLRAVAHAIWFVLAALTLYYWPGRFEWVAYGICLMAGAYLWASCRTLYDNAGQATRPEWLSFAGAVHIYAVLVLVQIYRLLLSAWLSPALSQLMSLVFLASVALCFSWVIFSNLRGAEKPGLRAPLSVDEQQMLADWNRLMRERKLYLDARLSVADFAGGVGVNARQVSDLINRGEQKSFTDWVNHFRVQEAIARMADSDAKLLAVALDAGFNSKSNFNAVFKRYTGQTPGGYRRQLRDDSGPAGLLLAEQQ